MARTANRPRRRPPDGAPDSGQRTFTLRWGAILGGLAVAYVASVAMGVLLARASQAASAETVPFLYPFVQFIALFAGGYVAGRWARTSGFMNGAAVAIAFIVVWSVLNAVLEAQQVQQYGPLALPRMNIPGILLGDILNLSAAAFGGWLAERKQG